MHESRLSLKLKRQYANEIFGRVQKKTHLMDCSILYEKTALERSNTVEIQRFTFKGFTEQIKAWLKYQGND